MSEYEDGLNVACWDRRRTWVKIILSFVPLGLLFVCLTDVRPLCVCKERLHRRALWSASLLISAYLCGLSPALTDARAGAAAPLLHTQIGQSSIVREGASGGERASLPLEPLWQIRAGFGGQRGHRHEALMLCSDSLWHCCTGAWANGEGICWGHCACVLSQVHISVISLCNVRIKVVARENLGNSSFALLLLNGTAVPCSEFHWLD